MYFSTWALVVVGGPCTEGWLWLGTLIWFYETMPPLLPLMPMTLHFHDVVECKYCPITKLQELGDGWGQKEARAEFCSRGVPKFSNRLPYLGLPCLRTRSSPEGRADRATQMGTKGKEWSIYWSLDITCRVIGPIIKYQNWACFPPVPWGIWQHILYCGAHEEGTDPKKLGKPGRGALRAFCAGNFILAKEWHLN